MARNTKDEAQDIVLRQMEKVSRSADRKGERKNDSHYDSLESQLKRQAEYDKLSHEQKIARVPRMIWRSKLIEHVVHKCSLTTHSTMTSLLHKRSDKFDEFHQAGTPFNDIVAYIKEEMKNFNF